MTPLVNMVSKLLNLWKHDHLNPSNNLLIRLMAALTQQIESQNTMQQFSQTDSLFLQRARPSQEQFIWVSIYYLTI